MSTKANNPSSLPQSKHLLCTKQNPVKIIIQQIRNATLKINYAGITFLIDPLLAAKGSYPGFKGTARSQLRNPLVELPLSISDILSGVDAIIVTHTHLDHWDNAAQKYIPKHLPVFGQNHQDVELIRSQGFTNVQILDKNSLFRNICLSPIVGQHGTESMYANTELAKRLDQTIGVIFQAENSKTLYIAGDTIWCDAVTQAIQDYQADIIILNTGYAQINNFAGSIIMGKDDVKRACQLTTSATVVATHMEAVNHALLTRAELRAFTEQEKINERVFIPEDGEMIII